MPDDDPSVSRRRVVATAGLAAASGLAAGCTSTLPPLGARVRFGRVDAPAADPPDYRRWIPAPDAPPSPAPHTDTARPAARPSAARRRAGIERPLRSAEPCWVPFKSLSSHAIVSPAAVIVP